MTRESSALWENTNPSHSGGLDYSGFRAGVLNPVMSESMTRRVNDCLHRRVTGSSAHCELVSELMGVSDPGLTLVELDACRACCDSFLPGRRDPNFVVASLLYQACETVLNRNGVPGLTVEAARDIQKFAEEHLPAIRGHEDEDGEQDKVVELPGDSSIEAVVPLPEVTCGSVRKWCVGITTAPRRVSSLDATLEAIVNAGWSRPRIFVDGDVQIPQQWSDLPVSCRTPRIGAWPSYYLALTEMFMRDPSADAYALFQDDIELLRRADLRTYLERVLWPGENPGILSLYCSSEYTRKDRGWHRFPENWIWGATAFVFSPDAVRGILSSVAVIDHRLEGAGDGLKGIDVAVGQWAERTNTPIWFPTPSLVQHTGQVSTLWDTARAVASRRAGTIVRATGTGPSTTKTGQKKLVMLSTGRCGTTLLQQALSQHSKIRMGGEPFCQDPKVNMFGELLRKRFAIELPDEGLTPATRRRVTNADYMDAVLECVDVVSIHYWQLGSEFGPVDYYLLHRPDVRVLQLVRRNDFERYVSLQFALRNKVWHTSVGQSVPEQSTLRVDPADFLESTIRAEADRLRFREFFGDRLHTFYYEDIVSDWYESMAQIQRLLKVPVEPLQIRLQKTIRRPMHELVENYEEVREHCRNTAAEKYFQ